jgi:hypothetical protein
MRRLSPAEATWQAWKVDGELHGHTPAEVLLFHSAMEDIADGLHPNLALVPAEPRPRRKRSWRRGRRRLTDPLSD